MACCALTGDNVWFRISYEEVNEGLILYHKKWAKRNIIVQMGKENVVLLVLSRHP